MEGMERWFKSVSHLIAGKPVSQNMVQDISQEPPFPHSAHITKFLTNRLNCPAIWCLVKFQSVYEGMVVKKGERKREIMSEKELV